MSREAIVQQAKKVEREAALLREMLEQEGVSPVPGQPVPEAETRGGGGRKPPPVEDPGQP